MTGFQGELDYNTDHLKFKSYKYLDAQLSYYEYFNA